MNFKRIFPVFLLLAVGMTLGSDGAAPLSVENKIAQLKKHYEEAFAAYQELENRYRALYEQNEQMKRSADIVPYVCEGRLTVVSGTPVPVVDETDQSTLYFTPYLGSRIAVYTSVGLWQLFNFSELSLNITALGLASDSNFDVFVYDSGGGVLVLELSDSWNTDLIRDDNLQLLNGVWVKAADNTRRYLGTVRTLDTDGNVEDSSTHRFVWNYYNRAQRVIDRYPTGGTTYNYGKSAWRNINNSTGNTSDFVVGMAEVLVRIRSLNISSAATSELNWSAGFALDGAAGSFVNVASLMGGSANTNEASQVESAYTAYPAAGHHVLNWIESSPNGTVSFWRSDSTNNPAQFQAGFLGVIDG
jgi:hypothetical protein